MVKQRKSQRGPRMFRGLSRSKLVTRAMEIEWILFRLKMWESPLLPY